MRSARVTAAARLGSLFTMEHGGARSPRRVSVNGSHPVRSLCSVVAVLVVLVVSCGGDDVNALPDQSGVRQIRLEVAVVQGSPGALAFCASSAASDNFGPVCLEFVPIVSLLDPVPFAGVASKGLYHVVIEGTVTPAGLDAVTLVGGHAGTDFYCPSGASSATTIAAGQPGSVPAGPSDGLWYSRPQFNAQDVDVPIVYVLTRQSATAACAGGAVRIESIGTVLKGV